MLTGCSNDEASPIENITIVEEGSVKPAQKAESTLPTAILGNGGSLSDRISGIFTNQVEADKAKHVVVACSDLETYAEELQAAYQRGSVITVVDPDAVTLASWCASKGMVYPGVPEAPNAGGKGNLLISFNRKAASMSVQKRLDGDDIVIEDEGPLVIFTGWLDDMFSTNLKGVDFRSRDIKKRFAPQRVTHVFPIEISVEEISIGGWCLPAGASLSTTASLKCDIYPMHSFADNAYFSGDIYAVEAELTIHNGNLYNGRWQYSQGDKRYESGGFYLSDCTLAVSLYEHVASGMVLSGSHMFAAGPAPASTDASSSCQTGFEWSFDGWLTGGNGLESSTPTPLQEGGWTWNNLAGNGLSGLNIETQTERGGVAWTLAVPDDSERMASGDLTFHFSWIWEVPQATVDSTDRYYMNVHMSPNYRWTRNALPGSRIEDKTVAPAVLPACFMLIPPSRTEGQRI